MIVFNVRTDGMVESLPSIVPQASALADIVVISAYDYAYCHIRLTPSSGIYIPDVMCTPVLSTDRNVTMWTAPMPPEVTKMGGIVGYQIFFSAADGTTQKTNPGTFPVPRCEISTTPEMFEEASNKTIQDIYNIFANVYGAFVGLDREAQVYHPKVIKNEENIKTNTANIAQNKSFIDHLLTKVPARGEFVVPTTEWEDSSPDMAIVNLPGETLTSGDIMLISPADDVTGEAAKKAYLSVSVSISGDYNPADDIVVFNRYEKGEKPRVDMRFVYVTIHTNSTEPAMVYLTGMDAYGGGTDSNLYIGTDIPPPDAQIWINPEGDPAATEVWEFDLESGDTETKRVVVLE